MRTRKWIHSKLFFLLVGCMFCGFLIGTRIQLSSVKAETGHSGLPGHTGLAAKTVFVDVGPFGKHNRAAKHLTREHVKQAKSGWTVLDVEPYTENGDLEGFFVTYVKK